MMAAWNSSAEGEDELVPISALQHMLYCPRQCALIHIERQWAENRYNAEGHILHKRVDDGGGERRGAVRVERGVPLRSLLLGVSGVADVVEMRDDGCPYPVEYKRGRPKAHRADEVQLCAQALCLEEMLGKPVPEGALFYGRNRRRKVIAFDADLRALTEHIAGDTRRMFAAGETPLPEYEPHKCGACSLQEICQPEKLCKSSVVARWITDAIDS